MYPIWIHDKKNPKPDVPVHYEISASGVFLHKETPFWKAVVPVDRISILEEQAPQFQLLLPPLPKEISKAVARFFAWITLKYNTEVLVLLWWGGVENNAYEITVPPQSVNCGSIKYGIPQKANYRLIGSFHSHGSMKAFHSSVDTDDEINFDGIHGTFGGFFSHTNQNLFNLSIQACVNETRFDLDLTQYLEGVLEDKQVPDKEEPRRKYLRKIQKFYLLSGEEKLLPDNYEPPSGWLDNVRVVRSKELREFLSKSFLPKDYYPPTRGPK